MSKVIGVINQKGGCGKTNTVINLARGLQKKHYSVVIIDNDDSGGCLSWRDQSRNPEESTTVIHINSALNKNDISIFLGKVDYIIIDGMPGYANTKEAVDSSVYLAELSSDERVPAMIRDEIIEKTFDIFGPSRKAKARNASIISMADFIILPVKTGELDKLQASNLIENLILPKQQLTGKPDFALLINQCSQHSLIIEKSHRRNYKASDYQVFETAILQREIFKTMFKLGSSVLDINNDSNATAEINSFIDEFLQMTK